MMTKQINPGIIRHPLARWLSLICVAIIVLSIPNYSYSETKASFALSQNVYRKLEEIRALIGEEKFTQAQQQLANLRNNNKLSSYESAQVWNLTAYSNYLADNYPAAITAYQKVLAEKNIPDGLAQSTHKTLAQLHYSVGSYQQAINALQQLESAAKLDDSLWLLKAHCYYQLHQYSAATKLLESLVKRNHQYPGKIPKENWLNLLQACYHHQDDYANMARTLELLVSYYPKQQHLLALASVYSQVDAPLKQLALLESLWESQHLTKSAHIKNLIALQLQAGVPYKAAQIMEKAMQQGWLSRDVKHQKQLAQTWIAAKEESNAISSLEVALQTDQPVSSEQQEDLCLLLGQLYFSQQAWQATIERMQACQPAATQHKAKMQLLLGIAYVNTNKLTQGKSWLERAADNSKTQRQADQWLAHIEREQQRQAQLQQLTQSN